MKTSLLSAFWALRRRAGKLLLVVVASACLGIASCGDVPDGGKVVAKVNGEAITYGDLLRELKRRHGPVTLLDMIDDALVHQEAQKRGMSLSDREREVGLARAAARVGSMTDLELKLARAGISIEAYRHDIDTNLLLDKIALQEIKVSDAEIEAYYRARLKDFERGARVRARMMLFRDKASAEAIQEALNVEGSDFAGLAKALSEDEMTAEKGGDTGYFEQDDYALAISKVAFKLEPGETSGLIEAPDGYVILRIEDRKPAGPLSLDEVKKEIRQRLRSEKQQEARDKWLVGARKQAPLSIRDKELRKGVMSRLEATKPIAMPGQL